MHLDNDFVGEPDQSGARELAKVDVAEQITAIVALPGSAGSIGQARGWRGASGASPSDPAGLGPGVLVFDAHRPRTMRMPVVRHARRPVDRAHLGAPVRGDRGRVERRILDGVTHAADVLIAQRLEIEQCAAMIEPELAVVVVPQA